MQDSLENRGFLADLTPLGACEVLERRIYTHYRLIKTHYRLIKSHYEVSKETDPWRNLKRLGEILVVSRNEMTPGFAPNPQSIKGNSPK